MWESKIKIVLDKCNKKLYKLWLLLVIVFFVFRNEALRFFDDIVVHKLLSKANNEDILLDAVVVTLSIVTILLTTYFTKHKYNVSDNLYYAVIVALIIYSFARFTDRYFFYHFSFTNTIVYTDYLLILFWSIIIIRYNSKSNPYVIESERKTFIIDTPLVFSSDDLFERAKYAREIAAKLQTYHQDNTNSLAIGIVGSWGVGKTTFANMICESLNSEKCIIIHYNPWRSTSPAKIIEDFFVTISAGLKKYNPTLSVSINEYANAITKIEENIYAKASKAFIEIFDEKDNVSDAYKKINHAINRIKLPVIVIIDDLDRLDKTETIEVLRLIRNTANFNNFSYIVCYDREYVLEAVKRFNSYNYKQFLEKIFQFEFTLPLPDYKILQAELKRIINANTENRYKEFANRVIGSKEHYNIDFTKEIIKTYRDVIRLANSLCFEINIIRDDVFFPDFYLLQLLKIKFRPVYDLLHVDKDLLFMTDVDDNGAVIFILRPIKHRWTDIDLLPASLHNVEAAKIGRENRNENDATFLDSLLSELKIGYSDHETVLIKSLVKSLLVIKKSDEFALNIDLYKSFVYVENYYKYFSFKLAAKDIPAEEFENYRQREFTDYKTKILEWIGDGNLKQVNDRLQKINAFSNKHQYGNHVMATMLIGRTHIVEEREPNFNYLRLLMEYPLKQTHLFDTISEATLFLSKIFYEAEPPALYESLYITGLIDLVVNRNYNCLLKRENLVDINVHYLYDYCRKNNDLNDDFFQLHRNTIVKIDNNFRTKEKHPEAEKIHNDYIKKNLRTKQLGLFIDYTKVNKHKHCRLNKEKLEDIFGSIPEFTTYLYSTSNIDTSLAEFKEFIKFMDMAKKNDYSNFYYDFKSLETQGYHIDIILDGSYNETN